METLPGLNFSLMWNQCISVKNQCKKCQRLQRIITCYTVWNTSQRSHSVSLEHQTAHWHSYHVGGEYSAAFSQIFLCGAGGDQKREWTLPVSRRLWLQMDENETVRSVNIVNKQLYSGVRIMRHVHSVDRGWGSLGLIIDWAVWGSSPFPEEGWTVCKTSFHSSALVKQTLPIIHTAAHICVYFSRLHFESLWVVQASDMWYSWYRLCYHFQLNGETPDCSHAAP